MESNSISPWMKMTPQLRIITAICWLFLFALCLGGIVASGFPSHIKLWTGGTNTLAKVENWEEIGKGNRSQGRYFKMNLSFQDSTGKKYTLLAYDRMKKYPPNKIGLCYENSDPYNFAIQKDMWIGIIGTSMSLFAQLFLIILAFIMFRKKPNTISKNDVGENLES